MMQRRRSGIDGRTLARRLGCNKQGFSTNDPRSSCFSSSEGCKATILVKMEKSGKWVVTRFVKEHNHSLQFIGSSYNSFADKDRKIKELAEEIECQERLCDASCVAESIGEFYFYR
ncbi:FAR1 DNA binding domain [Arabidopsis thaliana x Arabidopsis arenosa]|uniref:FAR1 DNA binding domain n=1 Tax=Arabidopsis thaliana x Arabidopsis arenosa TaxID=1240361 RepID=A0A8T1YBM4_9BRAS|nr:FAR1 DNA binding domain [Arabidopsis thaliana x Arabidopsis arenosa]